jgi:hypothetical protein
MFVVCIIKEAIGYSWCFEFSEPSVVHFEHNGVFDNIFQ